MGALEKEIPQFASAAAELIDELSELIVSAADIEQDAAEAGRILSRYSELVQRIGELAWNSGLPALQSVCAILETNLMLLGEEGRALTSGERELLEEWPMLLLSYQIHHADRESSNALLQHLSSGAWPMPLPEASAAEELPALMGESASLAAPSIPASVSVPASPASVPASDKVGESADPISSIGMQQVGREMIVALASELELMNGEIAEYLAALAQGEGHERQAALENYVQLLERLGATVESVGLIALGEVFSRLRQQLVLSDGELSSAQVELLHQLPSCLAAYFAQPDDAAACAAIVGLVAAPAWPEHLGEERASAWRIALANVELREAEVQKAIRPTQASEDDISLELPRDVSPDLLDGLLQELPVHTSMFTTAIASVADGRGTQKDLEVAMRAAHTLKGAANTVGVPGIANLTHHAEDILTALIEAERLPQNDLARILTNVGDCLEEMSEALRGLGPKPSHALEVMQEVLDWANRIDRDGVDATPADVLPFASVLDEQIAEPEISRPAPVAEQALRVPAPVVDELLRLAGETLISNSQIQERLQQATRQSQNAQRQHQLVQRLISELEKLVDIRGISSPLQMATRTQGDFDALEFQNYNELDSITRQLIEATTDAQEMTRQTDEQLIALDELLDEQHRLQIANQLAVMRTRMVQVASVSSRLQRSVRQTCRLLDKKVELSIRGENTNIDSQVLNDLMDPLMHILRNAVDHGIETPEDRVASGKSAQGHIELTFAREGSSIVVRCSDDGAGLDYEAIKRIAARKGMVTPDQFHTEEELARLILAPGFSTREETSQISGRGVGMDVVHNRVREMKGALSLNSHRGQGLTVELRLPATLLSTHALIVRQYNRLLAISSHGIEDIRYLSRDQILEIGDRKTFRDGDAIHELLRLDQLLSLPADRREKDRYGFPVLLTRKDDGSTAAVLIQEIIGSREVVMKNFGRYVPRSLRVIGAIILGDGSVAPVIDLVELLSGSSEPIGKAEQQLELPEDRTMVRNKVLRALVVDDSLSTRRALVQVLSDAGHDVRTANDGLDAMNMLGKYVPDIILTDMEMPRVNGLELTAHIRHSEKLKHIPVIMLTSRSTEKHRQMSAAAGVDVHLIKPFSDEVLLQHVARLTQR